MKVFVSLCLTLLLTGQVAGQGSFNIADADILELQGAMESGELSSAELVRQYLERIAAYDRAGPALNSLVRVNPAALQAAEALDQERRRSGPRGPLHGIPVIIKDNYNTTDLPTTGSSVALAGFIPTANATQVQRLLDAGAIVLAKANLHEFAYGITSIGSLAGQTRNPYDPRRAPGGSSGGTAAAVAASLGAVGMGSDTCGSIRIPAAFNNLVGLRPTKGLSSIYGVMPLSHTQDVAGPLARSVTDLAIVLDAVSGFDANDPATAIMADRPAPDFLGRLDSEALAGLRVGRLTDYFERANGTVAGVIDTLLETLKAAGVEVVEVEIPELNTLISRSGLIGHEFRPDLDAYLATFGSVDIASLSEIVDQGLYHEAITGPLTRSRASEFNEQAYLEALAVRTTLRSAVEEMLAAHNLDAIVYPPIGELQVFLGEAQSGSNCSISANSGLPAISLPAGFTASGLPVGVELLGAYLSDTRLVSIAHQVEKLVDLRREPLATPPLVDGLRPAPREAGWALEQNGLRIEAELSYDQTTRQLHYDFTNHSIEVRDLYGIGLLVRADPGVESVSPILASLLPPETASSTGTLFVEPALHDAIMEGRVGLRVFASDPAVNGTITTLQFRQ